MEELKEKIMGMVRIMDEKNTEMLWKLIQATFYLGNAETAEPTEDETRAICEYRKGNPEYRPAFSHDEVLKELGL